MTALGGKIAMVGCAITCGVGVAGTAFALSQTRAPGASGALARAASRPASGATSVVTGLAAFQPAALPAPLHLDPLVVHPHQVIVRGSTFAPGGGTGSGSDNPWAGGAWSPSGSGGGSGSGGTPTPPPPPPPVGTTHTGTTGGGTTVPSATTSTGTTSTPSPTSGSTSTGSTSSGGGSTTTTSPTVVAVALPRNTAPPTITGDNVFGSLLTAHPGTWSGNPTTLLYTWLRCSTPTACVTHATGPTYRTVQADLRFMFIVVVTATNAGGSRSARSNESDTVQR